MKTKYFGNIDLNNNESSLAINTNINGKQDIVNIYIKNYQNENNIIKILDDYLLFIDIFNNYFIENYRINNDLQIYFENVVAKQFGGIFDAYIMLHSGQQDKLDELNDLPVNEKLKYIVLPDISIKGIDDDIEIQMTYDVDKSDYSSSIKMTFDKGYNIKNIFIDIIDPWK
jgi:hypothetical protein